ncbi:ABC transporter permease/substrate-binding protein [Parasphingopyxis lamellibrachiae]|uniref:Osmoprotectant transport system permease protein n=1 Tax=Parasphingopyxis lamellibrachiae TaxID=680125 RepID=A0A3D9FI76_9SPHN|nr:ABC transporter permease/substrate-binding protein [Parasphingopyxis lamellibrachiae]RED17485.1 osmoprotectant transport system permease protein [Parasphingopyxis lamellibrachiae]
MNSRLQEAFAQVPSLLADHVLLSAAALLLGLVVALPLAVGASRSDRLRQFALGLASLVQTIPGLALLALFYPLLLALNSALVPLGVALPALGFLPALLALGLYAVLPILRNAVTGIVGIDPAIIEAADGVGMTPRQKLRLVEAPLAAPVVMAGIRTATVWTIGAATLSTTVGQSSLGDMIFAGLQTQNWTLVLVGCLAAAALALTADALLGLIETGIAQRRRWMIGTGLIALFTGVAIALAPLILTQSRSDVVTIGAKGFSEQYILARLIGDRLEGAGYEIRYREGLGSAIAFEALARGDVDVYVDYTGTLWTNAMRRDDNPPRDEMLDELTDWVADTRDARVLGRLGFENTYAFAVTQETARRHGLESIDDLAGVAPQLTMGTDVEFLNRPEWASIRAAYGLAFGAAQSYQPTFMYRAVESGRADVITAFSSDGRIAASNLAVLSDPRGAIPNYDAVLIVAPGRADDEPFVTALTPLLDAIPVEAMREANYMVDRDEEKASPGEAAAWLADQIAR